MSAQITFLLQTAFPIGPGRHSSSCPQKHCYLSSMPAPAMAAQSNSLVLHLQHCPAPGASGHKIERTSDSPSPRLFAAEPFQTAGQGPLLRHFRRKSTDARRARTGTSQPGTELYFPRTPAAGHPLPPSSGYPDSQNPEFPLPFRGCRNQIPVIYKSHPGTEGKFQSHQSHPAFLPAGAP